LTTVEHCRLPTTDEGELTAARGPTPGETGAAALAIPITPGWEPICRILIDGWMVREVYGATAVLVGGDRAWTVRPGDSVPALGRIDSITRWGSRWIVVTTSGRVLIL
jgi:hypothetical protein